MYLYVLIARLFEDVYARHDVLYRYDNDELELFPAQERNSDSNVRVFFSFILVGVLYDGMIYLVTACRDVRC